MRNRLFRLRHDPIIGSHHQHHNICALRATCAHGGEGRMTGCIQKGDRAAFQLDLISADMLGDATRFAFGHVGMADRIQQGGLTMIDVTQNGHDRRAD